MGRIDPPLNRKGQSEAADLARMLQDVRFDAAYTGVSQRSRQSLDLIWAASDTPRHIDERMDEIGYGAWEGLTKANVVASFPSEWREFDDDPTCVPPGGESVADCRDRAVAWLADIQADISLAVVEKTWMRLLLCDILGIPVNRYRTVLDLKIAAMTILVTTAVGWRLEALNYGATPIRVFE